MTQNRYGLSREIPEDVKRIVRRECGFGCVICGLAIAQYDHFDPPFKDAKEHNPAGIVALCGACHDKKSRGFWSAEKIAEARKKPITFQAGYSRDAFDLKSPFVLGLGSSPISNVSTIVRTEEGERWFVIEDSEVQGGPVRLSALFYDKNGRVSLEIQGNEWRCFSGQWDFEVVGKTITVRKGPDDIALQLVVDPPHVIRVTRLVMQKGDIGITIEPPGVVTIRRGEGFTIFEDNFVSGADSVFVV
ncbi:MAG: HNH endonuclease [Nitrospira sp.]|nr:HNH endonuclease [Nitrospira sp.]